MIGASGVRLFPHDPGVAVWAQAALRVARPLLDDPANRAAHLRHGKTWFVGVDLLPNRPDGAVGGVPLAGAWRDCVADLPLHPAQVSVIYPGYPQQDAGESDANHRFRRDRAAAHVDGLLPEGPERRRFAREFHAYILALPLNDVTAAPTVVWPGSHLIMQAALRDAIGDRPVAEVDLTEAYAEARRAVFAQCRMEPLALQPGQVALLHRHLLHGVAPWDGPAKPEGRIVAFFRPECAGGAAEWLHGV
ncbi:hypothetical protein [Sulfitobacter sp. S190]|uniref:hypothetical protein n=1 Tax=Sulfitobacter sp. S190 TaxID=2867022 RepID=UPI0021A6753A|nr:hypothetical protein [Sulfitobacter sp. S190]UWR21353.1 hypothetical protein K3756_11600 [Sulfitobacter sp. S190]